MAPAPLRSALRRPAALAAVVALYLLPPALAQPASPAPAEPIAEAVWRQTEPPSPVAAAASETSPVLHAAWSIARPPHGPYDRVTLHRYSTAGPSEAAGERPVVLYLPGTFMNGSLPEPTAGADRQDPNLWLFLARRGVDVFTLDYRTRAVPDEGVEDFTFLADWGLETFLGDVRAAAREARRLAGTERLVAVGFSRGVGFAYALAAAEPSAVAGVVALDGFFKHHAPKGRLAGDPRSALAASGRGWASDVAGSIGWSTRQSLMAAAIAEPAGPAAARLAGVLYGAWAPGALANPAEGPGSGPSRAAALARLMIGYDRYYPRLQDFEAVAWGDLADDPRTPVDDGWPSLRLPVFYVGTTGMGAEFLLDGIASARHCAGDRFEMRLLEGWGHLDLLVAEDAPHAVFAPLAAWIDEVWRSAGESEPTVVVDSSS